MVSRRQERSTFGTSAAIVTGASRGIGLAVARALLERGARVAICARDPERLQRAAAQLGAAERLFARPADVSDPDEVTRFVEEARAAIGAVGVLVNNAGIVRVGPFAEEPPAALAMVLDVNLKGAIYLTRALLPEMIARGQGTVINVASGAGLAGFPRIVSYCASKFGLVGFSEALDRELRGAGVRVYAVCPGRVATDMQVAYSGARVGMPPEAVAEVIVALAARRGAGPRRCVVPV